MSFFSGLFGTTTTAPTTNPNSPVGDVIKDLMDKRDKVAQLKKDNLRKLAELKTKVNEYKTQMKQSFVDFKKKEIEKLTQTKVDANKIGKDLAQLDADEKHLTDLIQAARMRASPAATKPVYENLGASLSDSSPPQLQPPPPTPAPTAYAAPPPVAPQPFAPPAPAPAQGPAYAPPAYAPPPESFTPPLNLNEHNPPSAYASAQGSSSGQFMSAMGGTRRQLPRARRRQTQRR